MATKAKYATIKDCKAGKSLWVVWLGNEFLEPELIRVASRPHRNHLGTWIRTVSRCYTKQYLGTLGIVGDTYSGRHTFVTEKAALRFCKDHQDSAIHSSYKTKLEERNAEYDIWYPACSYDEYPTPEEELRACEAMLGARVRAVFSKILSGEAKQEYVWSRPVGPRVFIDWPVYLCLAKEGYSELTYLVLTYVGNSKYRLDALYHPQTDSFTPVQEYYTRSHNTWRSGWVDHSLTDDEINIPESGYFLDYDGDQDVEPTSPSRDWTEDFADENGNYECRCTDCEETFFGYKRRIVCKVCATSNIGTDTAVETTTEQKEIV